MDFRLYLSFMYFHKATYDMFTVQQVYISDVPVPSQMIPCVYFIYLFHILKIPKIQVKRKINVSYSL